MNCAHLTIEGRARLRKYYVEGNNYRGTVKTIICDRDGEFANWRQLENELNCDIYFIDPYRAWRKVTNENLNGLLRTFYPKGGNLSLVSPKTLKKSGVN